MKMYLHVSIDESQDVVELIVRTLKETGVLLVTNIEENYEADFSAKELRNLKMSGQNLLDKMDAFIIEASKPDPEVGYLLAYAMSQKKPVLYLVEKGIKLGKQLSRLPASVIISDYDSETLVQNVLEFLRHLEKGWDDANANIKFTLRITHQIERYITWKSKRKKKSKADFLRSMLVEDIIEKDEQYQKYLKGGK